MRSNEDGTFSVGEQFENGSLATVGGPSPAYHEWKNASADRGGDGGDIATG